MSSPCNFCSRYSAAAATATTPLVMESIGDPPSALTATEQDGNAPNPRIPSQPTNIGSLPDELLSEVLLRNSAEDIHQRARFVCKRWRRTIHRRAFITAHFDRSGYGLILPAGVEHRPTFVGASQGGGIELSELSCELGSTLRSSCNGLVLTMKDYCTLPVVNPATKGCFEIGEFCREGSMLMPYTIGIGIAYAAASMKYKVVSVNSPDWLSESVQCTVKTVGVDNTCRHIATQQLSPKAHKLLGGPLLTIEGFIHWFFFCWNSVLTWNAESEAFAESRVPHSPINYRPILGRRRYHYLSTGRHLSLLITCGDLLWEVWEMKGGSGEWKKVLPDIDLSARKSEMRQLVRRDVVGLEPVGWINYPEVLLFFPIVTFNHGYDDEVIIYNLDSDEIKSIKLPEQFDLCEALVHKNSLVCLS